jgi:GntR family transcriptional regulator
VTAADLERQSLHAVLSKAGFLPTRGRATVRAEAVAGEDLRLLGLRKGDALLVEQRIILDQRGHPLEFTESRYAAGRYALDVDFEVEDTAHRRR